MRIGIIGGSFNPPHNLHKEMGLQVLKNNLVDKVIYVPTGDKYAKDGLLDGTFRLDIMNWKKPEYILSKYKLIGLKRKGVDGTLPEIYSRYPNSLKLYDFKMEELSSTIVRKRIKERKIEELKGKLDGKVLEYIESYSLYQ